MAIEDPDFYDILDISSDADENEIRTAYLEAVKTFHPDRNPSPAAENMFKLVTQAYEVLGDPQKRKEYDSTLEDSQHVKQAEPEDQDSEGQYSEYRYSKDQYSQDQYSEDQYSKDQYFDDQYSEGQYSKDQYSEEQYSDDQHSEDQYSKRTEESMFEEAEEYYTAYTYRKPLPTGRFLAFVSFFIFVIAPYALGRAQRRLAEVEHHPRIYKRARTARKFSVGSIIIWTLALTLGESEPLYLFWLLGLLAILTGAITRFRNMLKRPKV